MAIHRGTIYEANFSVIDQDKVVVNITGWTFRAQFREKPTDDDVLVEITTASSGFSMISAVGGRFTMTLTPVQTLLIPISRVHFDIMRTDEVTGPRYVGGGYIKVRQPVTRDE